MSATRVLFDTLTNLECVGGAGHPVLQLSQQEMTKQLGGLQIHPHKQTAEAEVLVSLSQDWRTGDVSLVAHSGTVARGGWTVL